TVVLVRRTETSWSLSCCCWRLMLRSVKFFFAGRPVMNQQSLFKRMAVMAAATLLLFAQAQAADMPDTITVGSSAFDHHGTVPLRYTAYGDNVAPQITWTNLPAGTVQLALVMDDPVAPTPEPFVHWVAYNIPASAAELPEGLTKDAEVPGVAGLEGMTNGLNAMRQTGYFGPRPPPDGNLRAD